MLKDEIMEEYPDMTEEEIMEGACPQCVADFGEPYGANCDCGILCCDHCYTCPEMRPRDESGRYVSVGEWCKIMGGGYDGCSPKRITREQRVKYEAFRKSNAEYRAQLAPK